LNKILDHETEDPEKVIDLITESGIN